MLFVAGEATAALSVAGYIDLAAETARLDQGHAATAEQDAARTEKKLANPDFTTRAPADVVEETRAKLAEAQAALEKLRAALTRLETVG